MASTMGRGDRQAVLCIVYEVACVGHLYFSFVFLLEVPNLQTMFILKLFLLLRHLLFSLFLQVSLQLLKLLRVSLLEFYLYTVSHTKILDHTAEISDNETVGFSAFVHSQYNIATSYMIVG